MTASSDELKAAVERCDVSDLIARLAHDDCPFCRRDPYEYVDNGVGMEAVAVTCCDYGIALFQYHDELLFRVVGLMSEAAAELARLQAEMAEAEARGMERAAKIVEGEEWKGHYRKWQFWIGNRLVNSEIVDFCIDCAASIRAAITAAKGGRT